MLKYRQSKYWALSKRVFVNSVRRAGVRFVCRNKVPLSWCKGNNWGDALSPVMVNILSGMPVLHVNGLHHDRYLAIGSILGAANSRAEVWGSGFIRAEDRTIEPPRAVHAVRGPASRSILTKAGFDCPEVYGDPALLLPRFFNPSVAKQYSVGIIPHYIDKAHPWLRRYTNDPEVKVIDIEGGIEKFVREVKACQIILSSSLHGIICADAYEIPNAWIQLSNLVVGGCFKFNDYKQSIGGDATSPLIIKEQTLLSGAVARAQIHPLRVDLRKLVLSCPFLSKEIRKEIISLPVGRCGLPESFPMRGSSFRILN